MDSNRVVEYANFNITFGDKMLPMLDYFEKVIFPAFTDVSLKRDTHGKMPIYSFVDVEIKFIKDEYVLVGNFVKENEHEINTILKNNRLEMHNEIVPTAPYSRFIIFLKNHRMILVQNEKSSPDLVSFNATVRAILHKFRVRENHIRGNTDIPDANVNIIGIPLKETIEKILKDVVKVKSVKLTMFPLNNDKSLVLVTEAAKTAMQALGSNTGNINFNSPKNKKEIVKLAEQTEGMAKVTIKGKNKEGEDRTIKHDTIKAKSNYKINENRNISGEEDISLLEHAHKSNVPMPTSNENFNLYKRMFEVFKKLMNNSRR